MREPVVRRLAPLAVLSVLASAAGCATLGQVNIISDDQEMQMGAEFAAQLENELQFIRDPEIVGYVDSLGQAIAAASERPDIPYRFHVVDTDDVNAFAVPGGYLYVNRGLIEAADTESELAGVISHEIGHIVGRHSARQMTQQIGIAGVASLLLGENPGQLQQMVAGLVANGTLMSYSRDMESEADRYGVNQMYRVGLDPMGLATFFDKLKAMSGGGSPSGLETFFSTHPAPGDRAADVRSQLQQLPPKNLIEDRPRFHAVKQRVQEL
jgi:predicted Zn-dependent protease